MGSSASVAALLPRWTKRVSIEEGGRDPLGLSRVTAMITDFLLQGIITQTYRARYYSFYCWAIWHIETEEKPTSYQQFAAAFQRRDTLFTLASLEANPDSSPVGVRVAERKLQAAKQKREVACNFTVLPSNTLGAFGQYYTGSIYELGLTSRDQEGIYHVSASGEALARAFHETIVDTPYIKNKLFLDNSIPWTEFAKTAGRYNLDGASFSDKERDLLTNLFLSADLKSDRALMRRSSLGLLMCVLNAYNAAGVTLKYGQIWELVYAPYYYGQLQLSKHRTQFAVSLSEKTCAEFWQYFCLHQFLTQSLENLLTAVLDIVGGELSGLTVQDICARLTSEPFSKELHAIHGCHLQRPSDLMATLALASPHLSAAVCRENQLRFDLSHRSSESRVLDHETNGAGERAAVAVSLLAVLYGKWAGLNTEVTRMVSSRAGGELHTELVLPYVAEWFDKKLTWRQVLEPIVSNLILDQHDRIMYEKGKLESCWLHRTEGRVIKDQEYSPSFRSPRTDNSVSILTDLGLLGMDSKKQLRVTVRGNAMLRALR